MATNQYQSIYADVLLEVGIKLRKDQTLLIFAPIVASKFIHLLVEKAYRLGARYVQIYWEDQELESIRFACGSDAARQTISAHKYQEIDEFINAGAAILYLTSQFFGIFDTLDDRRRKQKREQTLIEFNKLYRHVQSNQVIYCLGAWPNKWWAKMLYPDLTDEAAFEQLWKDMAVSIYLDHPDPIATWNQRIRTIEKRKNLLNEKRYTQLVFLGLGTDLVIGLPDRHIWHGGTLQHANGHIFVPNLPTEEVFTMPHREQVNGTLTVHKSNYIYGSRIDSYTLHFQDGKIVDFSANAGASEIQNLLDSAENARYMGEIALVSSDTGLAKVNKYFAEAVYDENASCHFALGNAYRFCLEQGTEMTNEQFFDSGGNISELHKDTMIDSENMDIFGIKVDGTEELILSKGRWVLE